MKRYGHVYEHVYNRDALRRSYYVARKGKRHISDVIEFESNLGQNITQLQRELESESYKVGHYRVFMVKEPKKRLIMAMPFRDRVVQHAVCDFVLEPIFDRHMINTNCANRHGMGTHYGLKTLESQMKKLYYQYPDKNLFCLKCDISKYFYSISHQVMKDKLRRIIKDPKLLRLLDMIIESGDRYGVEEKKQLGIYRPGYGLPIGNLTSQLFAVYYLSDLDHFIKENLKIKHYIRYVDDFTLLHHDKDYLRFCKEQIINQLAGIELKLNQKSQVFSLRQGVDFLGFKSYLTPTGKVVRKIRRASVKRIKRKIKFFNQQFSAGKLSLERIRPSIMSWLGHAIHGDTYQLRKKIMSKLILKRETD